MSRITHLDTVRGAAIMGILVMNGVSFGLGNVAYFDIAVGSATGLDWLLAVLGEVFADQKFMGLFSLLFGASILLFTQRAEAKGLPAVRLSLWRNALLLGIGIIHSIFWTGDILVIYALCAPILLAVHRWSGRSLLVAGAAIFAPSPVLDWGIGRTALDSDIVSVLSGSVETVETGIIGLGILAQMFSRALGMMLIGMGLYQSGRLARIKETPGLLGKSIAAVVVGAVLSAAGVAWTVAQGSGGAAAVLGNIPNSLATVLMTLGYLGLLSWWDQHAQGALIERVRALGRMALTNYLTQTAVSLTLVQLIPTELVSRSTIWLGIVAIWAAQLAWSAPWLRAFRFGLLEWLWRCATYRRIEPMRRSPISTAGSTPTATSTPGTAPRTPPPASAPRQESA